SIPARDKHRLWHSHRGGAIPDRGAQPRPLGNPRRPAALSAVYRLGNRRDPANRPCRWGEPGLDHGAGDGRSIPGRRDTDRAVLGAVNLWAQYWSLARVRRGRRDLLDLVMGAHRPDPVDTAD